MAAIIGLSESIVEDICRRSSEEGAVVVPANYNTPEQLVISGEVAGVERAMALAKEAGAKRALRLNVSGAFHSPLMEVAAAGLDGALATTPLVAPAFPVYSNVSARPSEGMEDAKRLVVRHRLRRGAAPRAGGLNADRLVESRRSRHGQHARDRSRDRGDARPRWRP